MEEEKGMGKGGRQRGGIGKRNGGKGKGKGEGFGLG